LLHNAEMYFATNYLTTELADSKLKYGLFNRVISCHDRLFQNCQNSCSKCAPQALRRRRVSRVSHSSKATASCHSCVGCAM